MKFIYDKRENRIFKICGTVFTLMFLFAFLIQLGYGRAGDITTFGIICALLAQFAPIPAIASWYGYWDSSRYIKKLAEGGIEVPENKKLQPYTDIVPKYGEEEESKESVVLAVLGLIVTVLNLVLLAGYYLKWNPLMGSEIVIMMVARFILMIFWLIGSMTYWNQRLNERYRDPGVMDPSRKERTGLPKGILTIVICLIISLALIKVTESMTDYVYRSRLQTWYGESYREHIGEPAIYGQEPW